MVRVPGRRQAYPRPPPVCPPSPSLRSRPLARGSASKGSLARLLCLLKLLSGPHCQPYLELEEEKRRLGSWRPAVLRSTRGQDGPAGTCLENQSHLGSCSSDSLVSSSFPGWVVWVRQRLFVSHPSLAPYLSLKSPLRAHPSAPQ